MSAPADAGPDNVARAHRWRQRFTTLCGVFAALSASWVVLGSFDPFGFYSRLLAQTLFAADSLGPLATPVFRFTVGLLGATSAAFFVLLAYVSEHALPARWAYQAVWASLLAWFVLDSALSFYVGFWLNVVLVNVPCLAVLGVPLLALRRHVPAAADRAAASDVG